MSNTNKERVLGAEINQLDVSSFEKLSEKQKKLAYHLTNAGLAGRMIFLNQNSSFNVPIFELLISLYQEVKTKIDDLELVKKVHDTLFFMFVNNGFYQEGSGINIIDKLPLKERDLTLISEADPILSPTCQKLISLMFKNEDLKSHRTVQKEGVDVIKESGVNFYQNLTLQEVEDFRAQQMKGKDQTIPYGFNERLYKDLNGQVKSETICENGLYGEHIKKINAHLMKALEFTENEKQKKSIETLIKFYKTGDAKDFDQHCIAWVQDRDSSIYFINGLIESYIDPTGIACSYESLVAFKDPDQTEKVKKIIDNIQYFEDNLPVDQKYKKEKAIGLSASSVNVISMAGATSPVLPLGINLPNSETIRKEYGSKSVTLANVDCARNKSAQPLSKLLYLDKYSDCVEYSDSLTGTLHVDLHEIAGHGSCKSMDGVVNDSLSIYYAVIEETRADLVGLFYIADPKMKELQIFPEDADLLKIAQGKLISYITNGSIGQLRRVAKGKDLSQAHFRNRQLISTYLLDNADPNKLKMIQKDGAYYIELNDVKHVQYLVAKLLKEIQRIKSEGDFNAAKFLVETYGTKVDLNIQQEIIKRCATLNLATTVGFKTPILTMDSDQIKIMHFDNFVEEQIYLFNQTKI